MFNMIYEFNFCSNSVKCHNKDVVAVEALEVMGTLTENCDVLGTRETQHVSYLDPSRPSAGIRIDYGGGD